MCDLVFDSVTRIRNHRSLAHGRRAVQVEEAAILPTRLRRPKRSSADVKEVTKDIKPPSLGANVASLTTNSEHKCEKCPKMFSVLAALNMHRKKMHTDKTNGDGEKRLKCAKCVTYFDSTSDLKAHMAKCHAEDGKRKCEKCEDEFDDDLELRKGIHI